MHEVFLIDMPHATQRPERTVLIARVGAKEIGLVHTDAPRQVILPGIGVGCIAVEGDKAILPLVEIIVSVVVVAVVVAEGVGAVNLGEEVVVHRHEAEGIGIIAEVAYRGAHLLESSDLRAGQSGEIVLPLLEGIVQLTAEGVGAPVTSHLDHLTALGDVIDNLAGGRILRGCVHDFGHCPVGVGVMSLFTLVLTEVSRVAEREIESGE